MTTDSYFFSYKITGEVIDQAIKKAKILLKQRILVRQNLQAYSSNRSISVINQLGDQLLGCPIVNQNTYKEGDEPKNLPQDNMMPNTNGIEPKQQCFNNNEDMVSRTSKQTSIANYMQRVGKSKKSIGSLSNKQQQVNRKQSQNAINLHKLQLGSEQYDPQIQKMREETVRKIKEEEQKIKVNTKIKMTNKNGKINYDYDGNPLNIKQENRKNLVSAVVHGTIQIENEKKKDKKTLKKQGQIAAKKTIQKTSTLEGATVQQQQKNNSANSFAKIKSAKQETIKCLDAVEFSQIQNPLANLEIKQGVKVTFNKDVVQLRQKEPSVKDFKKAITNRQISKQEFSRLKQSQVKTHQRKEGSVVEQVKEIKQNQDSEIVNIDEYLRKGTGVGRNRVPRVKSSSAMRRSVTEIQEQKVKVEDMNLKNIMLNKLEGVNMKVEDPTPIVNLELGEQLKKNSFNKIDRFNLDYSRRRVESTANAKRPDSQGMQLPKIQQKNSMYLPKNRERVKDSSQMRRTSKKFEEILRV